MKNEPLELKKGNTYSFPDLQEFVSENEDVLILSKEKGVFGATNIHEFTKFKVYEIAYGTEEMISGNPFRIFGKEITVYCVERKV